MEVTNSQNFEGAWGHAVLLTEFHALENVILQDQFLV